jgi:hypothetical protein
MVFIAWLMVFFSKPLATRKDRYGRVLTLIDYLKGKDALKDSFTSESVGS